MIGIYVICKYTSIVKQKCRNYGFLHFCGVIDVLDREIKKY